MGRNFLTVILLKVLTELIGSLLQAAVLMQKDICKWMEDIDNVDLGQVRFAASNSTLICVSYL